MRGIQPTNLRLGRLAATALVAATAGLGASSTPAGAQGGGCVGPAGASAVEQYCEAIPRADGGRTKAGGNSSGSTLSARTQKVLTNSGGDGAAVKRLTDDGTESKDAKGSKASKDSAGDDAGTTPDGSGAGGGIAGPVDASGSPLKAATNAVENGPTAGPGLAWGIVGMSAFGAAAALLLRRRNHTIPPAGTGTGPSARSGDEPPSGPGA